MTTIDYRGDDELRDTLYPLMDSGVSPIIIKGFTGNSLPERPLPSAMIKHMQEKGKLVYQGHHRPGAFKTASEDQMQAVIRAVVQIVGQVIEWIRTHPDAIAWMRNGLDFGRLDRYGSLTVVVDDKDNLYLQFE